MRRSGTAVGIPGRESSSHVLSAWEHMDVIPAAKYNAHRHAVNRTMTASCAAAARAGDERGLDSAMPSTAATGGMPYSFSVEHGCAPPAATRQGIGIARDPEQPRRHHDAARNGDRLRTPHETTSAPVAASFRPQRAAGPARAAWLLLGRSSHHVAPRNMAARDCFRTRAAAWRRPAGYPREPKSRARPAGCLRPAVRQEHNASRSARGDNPIGRRRLPRSPRKRVRRFVSAPGEN